MIETPSTFLMSRQMFATGNSTRADNTNLNLLHYDFLFSGLF